MNLPSAPADAAPRTGAEAWPPPESGNEATPRMPLSHSLGYLTRMLSEAWTSVLHRKVDAHGVPQGQWRYLRELWEEDGLSLRDLAERTGRQGPTVISAVRLMERNGFIEIERRDHDRRTRIFLTPHGRELEAVLTPYLYEVEEIGLRGLSPDDIAAFRRIAGTILDNLDEYRSNRNRWTGTRDWQADAADDPTKTSEEQA